MQKALIFIDTETTGLDPEQHSPVQIGYIVCIPGQAPQSFLLNSQPTRWDTISAEALNITGFTIEDFKKYPTSESAYNTFRSQMLGIKNSGYELVFVAYNAKYDFAMMDAWFKFHDSSDKLTNVFSHHYVCVYELMKFLRSAGYLDSFPSLKLGSFYSMFGEDERNAHDALADIKVTYYLYNYLLNIFSKGFQNDNSIH